jgi:dTDP-4-dehydrorhamnose reductase
MNIIISGGKSRFSRELQNQSSNHNLIPLSKEEMDITDIESIELALQKYKPQVFIHTAALSRPMNLHLDNPDKSISLNIIGTSNCVLACIKYNVKFVYISTDFVYPGITGNYSEEDSLLPINKYAWSKLGGECACMLYDNSLILRMGMYDKPFPHNKAFTDVYKSCIWNTEAAEITFRLIDRDAKGIFNVGGERKSIFDFVSQENLRILTETKNNIQENIPEDSSMNITKLKKFLS